MFKSIIVCFLTVGCCIISAGAVSGQPYLATQAPELLSQIVLDISSQQLVGHPLVGSPRILLLDENSDLVSVHDLATDPITLSISVGSLTPVLIDNPALFSNGIIDLSSLDLTYQGQSGSVTLTASTATVQSSGMLVSMSGYDILDLIDHNQGSTIPIYANMTMAIRVTVSNGGNMALVSNPSLKAFFKAGSSSVKQFFSPGLDGEVDTITLFLPTDGLAAGADTLILATESRFSPETDTIDIADTLLIPVMVTASDGLSFVAGSLSPESVYSGTPFEVTLAVAAAGLQAPIDSSLLSLSIQLEADSAFTTVFSERSDHVGLANDTLTYALEAPINNAANLAPGIYAIEIDLALFVDGLRLELTAPGRDTVEILAVPDIQYSSGSLLPAEVASGEERNFQFMLDLNHPSGVMVDVEQSYFELVGSGFSARLGLEISGDTLQPGQNMILTKHFFVPSDLLGSSLSASLTLVYYQAGAGNKLTLLSDFDGQTIAVEELPLIQIIEATIEAPNSPLVNTGQSFQVRCRVENIATTSRTTFRLQMSSDGSSTFDSAVVIDSLPGNSIVEVVFNVQASAESNNAEVFRIDIFDFDVHRLPPLDNIALATIQQPAELSMSVILRGADNHVVDIEESFDLLINMVNTGGAGATDGRVRISTNGLDLGLPNGDTVLEEIIPFGTVRGVTFVAPSFDTTITIDVELVELPLDLNTGLPAVFGRTSFEERVVVSSETVRLLVELARPPSNLVLAGAPKELFALKVTNTGMSSISAVSLDVISMGFLDAAGNPVNLRSILEVGSTAFYVGNRKVTHASAGASRLILSFDDYVVPADSTVELVLKTRMVPGASEEFRISLDLASIKASFASGPLEGQVVPAVAPGEEASPVISLAYTLVEGSLEGSFMVRNNPINPNDEPAEFRYFLERPDAVQFLILTLSGEVVYELNIPVDAPGAATGENVLFWDGRNNHGHMVVNGVYVAVLNLAVSREQAMLKLAVMK